MTRRDTKIACGMAVAAIFGTGMVSAWLPGLTSVANVCLAQSDENPVYVDDSPRAWELFRRALDQAAENPSEAARLHQELLDQYALRVIPRSEVGRDLMQSVRQRVNETLLRQQRVLERYRLLQSGEANRLFEQQQYERLVLTRLLTTPALEAGLLLTQRDVEMGRFQQALDRLAELQEHPDLSGRRLAHHRFLRGLAAHYHGDAVQRSEMLTLLSNEGTGESTTLASELDRIMRGGPGPEVFQPLNTMQPAPESDLSELGDQPIWSRHLNNSLLQRRYFGRPDQQQQQQRFASSVESFRRTGELLTVAPTVDDRFVYINEGQHVSAIDRFSQREVWQRQIGEGGVLVSGRGSDQVGDMNIIALSGDHLVTLSGHAHATTRLGAARIVNLSASTGEVRWTRSINQLDGREDLEGLFPHGAPVVANDVVYVMARKLSRQLLTSAYVVALDLHTGETRWVQYIASSGGLQQQDMRPFSSVQHHDGSLYVETALGAIARLSARTGEIRWLHRYPVPIRMVLRNLMPWEMSAPVITRRGLVVLSPDHQAILLLNLQTGDQLERHNAADWRSPRYLLADQTRIYGIGNDVVAMDLDFLDTPLWTLSSSMAVQEVEFNSPRGRIQLAGSALLIPTPVALIQVDTDAGQLLRAIPTDGVGNPLAAGPQLFVATSDRLESYLPLHVAERLLREQYERATERFEPAMSLLRLAVRGEDAGLAIEAAELALTALGESDDRRRADHQRELFTALVDIDMASFTDEYELGLALHEIIAGSAITAAERVESLLSRATWLSHLAEAGQRRHLSAAIEAYQTILSDAELAASERRHGSIVRPASTVAVESLAGLLSVFGEDIYATQAARAEAEFAALRDGADVESLIGLMRTYPFAEVSRDAGMLAATLLAESDRIREAVALLNEVYAAATTPRQAAESIAAITRLSEQAGWRQLAIGWLDLASTVHGLTALPDAQQQPRQIEGWKMTLGWTDPTEQAAQIGPVPADQLVRRVEGRVVPVHPAIGPWTRDHVLLIQRRILVRLNPNSGEVPWTFEIGDLAPQVIGSTNDSDILLAQQTAGDAVVIMVNAETGAPERVIENLPGWFDVLRDPAEVSARVRGANPPPTSPNRAFDGREILALPGNETIILLRRQGGVIALDAALDEESAVWTADHELGAVYHAKRHDLAIALAGLVPGSTQGRMSWSGRITLLDPATGETLRTIRPIEDRPVRWMHTTDRGWLVFGTDHAVEMIDLTSLERRWAHVDMDIVNGWVFGDTLLAEHADRELMLISLKDGRTSPPQDVSLASLDYGGVIRSATPLSHDLLLVHLPERIVMMDQRGRIHGRDAIIEDRRYTHAVPTADRIVVISHTRRGTTPFVEQMAARSAFIDTIYILSHNGRIMEQHAVDSTTDELIAVQVIDGFILLSNANDTLVVTAPQGD